MQVEGEGERELKDSNEAEDIEDSDSPEGLREGLGADIFLAGRSGYSRRERRYRT